jgi:hypothetical protein
LGAWNFGLLDRVSGRDPPARLAGHRGDAVEVRVVVQDGQPVLLAGCNDDQIRDVAAVGLRFQPDADGCSLCFSSVCCTSAEHNPAMLASGREHAIRARYYYNPPQHLQPYVARVLATARGRSPQ